MAQKFDTSLADSQATPVDPVAPDQFDFDMYADYEKSFHQRCRSFWQADSGVLVYRRMRVAEVFSYGSKDIKKSLEWQLGALRKSMNYKADIPNFLEPWYGIGTLAGAYGANYYWADGQAPVTKPLFQSVADALNHNPSPIASTSIGKHTLEMIEYFMDKTKGKLPVSFTDTQSPLNSACNIVDISNFMMDTVMSPENVKQLLDQIADLLTGFTLEQIDLIGSNLVQPGHGFASSREFDGIGISDDNILMLSGNSYLDLAAPSLEKFGGTFGGPVFHSCGDWSDRIKFVKQIKGLKMVDGAFSEETDPEYNTTEPFNAFANTGIIVEVRIVGNAEEVIKKVEKLWQPGMKLIIVTYCKTPEEQEIVYDQIHQICQ